MCWSVLTLANIWSGTIWQAISISPIDPQVIWTALSDCGSTRPNARHKHKSPGDAQDVQQDVYRSWNTTCALWIPLDSLDSVISFSERFHTSIHFPNHQVIQVGHLFPNLNRLRQVSEHQPGCHLVLCADLRRWSKIAGSVSYSRTWASQNWEYTSNYLVGALEHGFYFPFHIWDI